MPAEGWQIGRRRDLAIGLLSVAPDDFHHLERERPFHVRRDRPAVSRALDLYE